MPARSSSLRQKSCDICVRGKRKCGQESPSCARCIKLGVTCTYKSSPTGLLHSSFPSPSLSGNEHPTSYPSPPPQAPSTQSSEAIGHSIPFITSFPESIQDILSASATHCPAQDQQHHLEEILHSISANTLPGDRVAFCIRQFKSYPQILLQRNRTQFIHLALYDDFLPLPQALQEAYSACALYSLRTDASAMTVFRIIEEKCARVIEGHHDSVSSSTSGSGWSIPELLAIVQAFCLFQIIRLFDGDIRQRAIAEQQEGMLLDWTMELLRRTEGEQLLLTPSWHDWIFGESVRRTIIMSLMIQGVYSVVKKGYCCISDVVTGMSFTSQVALWEAGSAYHWEKAFKEKDHFYVNNMGFEELMERGRRNDVDDMGLLMMGTYLGLDKLHEWSARGGFELDLSPILNK